MADVGFINRCWGEIAQHLHDELVAHSGAALSLEYWNNLLSHFLSSRMQLWVMVANGVHGFIITSVGVDPMSASNVLTLEHLSESVFVAGVWESVEEKMRAYAASNRCGLMRAYTIHESVAELASGLGADTSYKLVWEV